MKKRIFISMHYMELGGAEISLIGLLQAMDYARYEVDLFLHAHRGELMQFIPKEVNILPEIKEYAHIECPMKQALLDGCWSVLFGRMKAKWQTRVYLRKKCVKESTASLQYVADAVAPYLPSLYSLGEYDLAISYLNPHKYVLEKVKANKKICWIHTDYTRIDVNVEQELPIWSSYDHIMSISPDVTKTFLQVFTTLQDKIVEMENILSPNFVHKRAEEFDVLDELSQWGPRSIRLLSIGRFSWQKNFDNVPDICRRVREKGLNVKWFLIGYGGDEALIRQKIEEASMQEHVIVLGKRSNPYPYIKACDIYVQPSRYEGKSVTVREAQMLCKPVAVTNYPTATSQIKDGVDGVIIPLDNKGCADELSTFILNTKLQGELISYLANHDYGNMTEIAKLYQLMK